MLEINDGERTHFCFGLQLESWPDGITGCGRKIILYLAQKKIEGRTHYAIRESYRQNLQYASRDLFDLGTDPARFIVYPGGNSFYIHESIEEQLNALNVYPEHHEVEDIFWRFLDPDIQRALETFWNRQMNAKSRRVPKTVKTPAVDQFHIFDRRRILYLKCGRTDPRNITRAPRALFQVLKAKSRDEIEQMIMEMERILVARELKTYAYAIFNLQNFFNEWFARTAPKMLDPEKVDEHFIEEICRLNGDPGFWGGMESGDRLHEYLVRYVLMFFDYDYAPGSFIEEYIRNFINSRRDYRPPLKFRKADLDEAGALFKEAPAALKKMSRKDLVRRYRQRVQKLHPDKGGDPDRFIKLTRAYHELMRSKQ